MLQDISREVDLGNWDYVARLTSERTAHPQGSRSFRSACLTTLCEALRQLANNPRRDQAYYQDLFQECLPHWRAIGHDFPSSDLPEIVRELGRLQLGVSIDITKRWWQFWK